MFAELIAVQPLLHFIPGTGAPGRFQYWSGNGFGYKSRVVKGATILVLLPMHSMGLVLIQDEQPDRMYLVLELDYVTIGS